MPADPDGTAGGIPDDGPGAAGDRPGLPTPESGPLSPVGAATLLLQILEEGRSAVLLTRSAEEAGTVTGPAPRMLVWQDPEPGAVGTLGDPAVDNDAREQACTALASGAPPAPLVALRCSDGGSTRAYLELHHPPATLVIVGAGHIARPLAGMGELLGLRVTVLDDRPEFATRERFPTAAQVRVMQMSDPFAGVPIHRGSHVVLVTRGHRYDYECLLQLLRAPVLPGYLGLIGSRRRIRATFAQLFREGIPRERIDAIRAPLGLDLGAQTPAEIAVAVAAELVVLHRGGSGTPLRERERVLERFFPQGEGAADRGGSDVGSARSPGPTPDAVPAPGEPR